MSKHTPGPWLQSWDCDAPTGSDASPKYDGFEVVNNDNWPIAFIPMHFVFPPVRQEMNKREMDWDEASANLRLISAAPELLEALKALLNAEVYADGEGVCAIANTDMDGSKKAVQAARAVIAKAEGQS
jgi:hypothetical protein